MTETIKAAGDIEEFLDALSDVRAQSNGYFDATCPVCGGHSLRVWEGKRADLPVAAVTCWKNQCKSREIYNTLGFAYVKPSPMASGTTPVKGGRQHVYVDPDPDIGVVAIKTKVDGRMTWNRGNGSSAPMYRVHDCLNAAAQGETLYICEGEKDADALATHLDVYATTLPNHRWTAALAEQVRGAHLVMIVDDDPTGAKYARTQPAEASAFGLAVARVLFPRIPVNDVADLASEWVAGRLAEPSVEGWFRDADPEALQFDTQYAAALEESKERERLRRQAVREVDAEEGAAETEIVIRSLEELEDVPLEYIGSGWIPAGVTEVVSGKKGSLKSFLTISEMCHVAARGEHAFYFYAEGGGAIRRRIEAWRGKHPDLDPADRLHLVNVHESGVRLDTEGSEDRLVEAIRKRVGSGVVGLIGFDTLAKVRGKADENKPTEMGPIAVRAERIKTAFAPRCSVLTLAHTGHAGERSRGASSIEDDADVAATLERPSKGAMYTVLRESRTKDGAERDFTFDVEIIPTGGLNADGTPATTLVVTGWKAGAPEKVEKGDGSRLRIIKHLRDRGSVGDNNIGVAEAVGLSANAVGKHMVQLVEAGKVEPAPTPKGQRGSFHRVVSRGEK